MARHNIFVGNEKDLPDNIDDLAVVIVHNDTEFWFLKHDWAMILPYTTFPIDKLNSVLVHPILWF